SLEVSPRQRPRRHLLGHPEHWGLGCVVSLLLVNFDPGKLAQQAGAPHEGLAGSELGKLLECLAAGDGLSPDPVLDFLAAESLGDLVNDQNLGLARDLLVHGLRALIEQRHTEPVVTAETHDLLEGVAHLDVDLSLKDLRGEESCLLDEQVEWGALTLLELEELVGKVPGEFLALRLAQVHEVDNAARAALDHGLGQQSTTLGRNRDVAVLAPENRDVQPRALDASRQAQAVPVPNRIERDALGANPDHLLEEQLARVGLSAPLPAADEDGLRHRRRRQREVVRQQDARHPLRSLRNTALATGLGDAVGAAVELLDPAAAHRAT